MKRTKNQFHYALRRVRKAADIIKSQKLFEASLWGGGDLFEELKKTRGGRHTPDLPENVAGANGEEEICHKFRQVYCDLYNSASTDREMIDIKSRIEASVSQDDFSEILKISGATVKAAAITMKKGKADVSGSYSSDAIRHAPLQTVSMSSWPWCIGVSWCTAVWPGRSWPAPSCPSSSLR